MAAKPTYEELEKEIQILKKDLAEKNMFMDLIPDHVIIQDLEQRVLWTNRAAVASTGLEPEDIVGRCCYEIWQHRHTPCKGCSVLKAISEGKVQEKEMVTPDGSVFRVFGLPIYDQDGKITGAFEYARDITDRRQALNELKENEERLRQIFENMSSGVAVYEAVDDGTDFIFRDVNRAVEKIEKLSREALCGRRVTEVFPNIEEFGLLEIFQRVFKTGLPDNHPLTLYEDDRIQGWRSNYVYKLTPGEIVSIYDDLTEQKQAEESLLQAQEKLRNERNILQEVMNGAIDIHLVYLDREFNFVRVNNSYARTCGYRPEDMIGKNHFDLYPHPENEAIFREVRDTGRPVKIKDKPFTFPDQPERGVTYWDWSLNPVKATDGSVAGLVFSLIETTQRKRHEISLQESEEKYRTLFENMAEGVFYQAADGKITGFNQNALNMFGLTEDQFLGKSSFDPQWKVIHEDGSDFPGEAHPSMLALKTGEAVLDRIAGIFNPIKNDYSWLSINAIPQFTKGETKPYQVFVTMRDITEQKAVQKMLRQTQKMETIGQMAGGIAHDFNNILYPIMGFTQLSQDALPDDHPVQENLTDILEGTKRARDLIKRILHFSRQQETRLEPLTLQPIIKESYKLLRAFIPANIDLNLDLYDGKECVLCNDTEIHEIILNLCTNSYHAIVGDRGKIVIGLKKELPPRNLYLPSGDYLCLSVRDNGAGIADKIKDRIFDPYTTTKDVGKGSGLGLAVVYGIVQSCKGGIQVESDSQNGTEFRIFLPVTGEMETRNQEPENKDLPKRGKEHILFVDDEKSIVKLGTRVLEGSGYTVAGWTDSIQACEFFKSNPEIFDLVITDMSMPGMTGTDLCREILAIRPEIPVIICSGYNEKLDQFLAGGLKISACLDKPLSIENLLKTVRKVLDSP